MKGFCRDDRCGEPAFHVARTAPVNLAIGDITAEGIECPARADLHHVCVAVEVDAVAGPRTLAPRDDVPARIFLAVAGSAGGADQFRLETMFAQAVVQIFADQAIVPARRIQGGNADQVLGQRDEIITLGRNGSAERCVHACIVHWSETIGKVISCMASNSARTSARVL